MTSEGIGNYRYWNVEVSLQIINGLTDAEVVCGQHMNTNFILLANWFHLMKVGRWGLTRPAASSPLYSYMPFLFK